MEVLIYCLFAALLVGLLIGAACLIDHSVRRAKQTSRDSYDDGKRTGGIYSAGVAGAMRELDRLVARGSVEHVIEAENHAVEEIPHEGE